MYQLFRVDGATGLLNLLHQSSAMAETESARSSNPGKTIILFDFSKADKLSADEETKIIQDLIAKYKGELLRVTKGVTVSKDSDAVCCGAGSNCYCVVSGSDRYCEAYYCNASGYCWVVRCNIPCGC